MIAWDNMKVVALVSGTMERPVQIGRNPQASNAQYREFRMIANEQGGNREANITGTKGENGWRVANVQGSGVACKDIKMRWPTPTSPHWPDERRRPDKRRPRRREPWPEVTYVERQDEETSGAPQL